MAEEKKYIAQVYKVLKKGKGRLLIDAKSAKDCVRKARASIDKGEVKYSRSDDCEYIIIPIELDNPETLEEIEYILGTMKYARGREE